MSQQYQLTVINDSSQSGNFAIYQEVPDINVPSVFTLAWLAQPAHPTTVLDFTWTLDYSFVWSKMTDLKPGSKVKTSQSWDANLTTENLVGFDYTDGAYTFTNQGQGAYADNLYINQTQRVQSNDSSVGIGMAGKGTFLVPSQPNMNLIMTPKPSYWVVFGNFQEGEVLDITEVSGQAFNVEYKGTTSHTVEYTANNSWKLVD